MQWLFGIRVVRALQAGVKPSRPAQISQRLYCLSPLRPSLHSLSWHWSFEHFGQRIDSILRDCPGAQIVGKPKVIRAGLSGLVMGKSARVALSKLSSSDGRTPAYSGNCGFYSLSGSPAARSWKDHSTNQTIRSRRFIVEARSWGHGATDTLPFF